MKAQKTESMSRQNLLCRNSDSCNMEELVETEESTERRSWFSRNKKIYVATSDAYLLNWPGRNKGTQRCNILQAEEINLCHNMDLNVATQKYAEQRETRSRQTFICSDKGFNTMERSFVAT